MMPGQLAVLEQRPGLWPPHGTCAAVAAMSWALLAPVPMLLPSQSPGEEPQG